MILIKVFDRDASKNFLAFSPQDLQNKPKILLKWTAIATKN